MCDFDQQVVKKLMAENHGLTLLDLNKRSEYSSVTTMSAESYDELETPAVSPPMADFYDRLGKITSAIPPVDPEVLTLKHGAFLIRLLMEEVDLESASVESHDHSVLSIRAPDGPIGKVPGAKSLPNNMPVSEHDVHWLQQVLWAKAEGIQRRTRVHLLKGSWKPSIWSEEYDEEMTVPDPETPLVYSLNYAQQGHQEWDEDELPPKTAGRMKQHEKGKSNLHAEEDFSENLGSLYVDARLTKLIKNYQDVRGAAPTPLL